MNLMNANASFRNAVLSFGQKADYITARKTVSEHGCRLPPQSLYGVLYSKLNDQHPKSKEIICALPDTLELEYPSYIAGWANEIHVAAGGAVLHGDTPIEWGTFKRGRDVKDFGTGWIFPASYIPEEAFGNVQQLIVDPQEITKERGRFIVHPAGLRYVDETRFTKAPYVRPAIFGYWGDTCGDPHEQHLVLGHVFERLVSPGSGPYRASAIASGKLYADSECTVSLPDIPSENAVEKLNAAEKIISLIKSCFCF